MKGETLYRLAVVILLASMAWALWLIAMSLDSLDVDVRDMPGVTIYHQ